MAVTRSTAMPEDSTSQPKTVTLKLYMNRAPRLTVTYKDKHELFEIFKKKTQELGIPPETVFWIVDEGVPVKLNNANTLMLAAQGSSTLRLYACDTDDEDISCFSCDELAAGRRPWKQHGRHHSRSHSRRRSRGRSRSRDRSRSRNHSRGRRSRSRDRSTSRERLRGRHLRHLRSLRKHRPFPGFVPFDHRMMDPRFGHCPPFGGDGRRVGGRHGFYWP